MSDEGTPTDIVDRAEALYLRILRWIAIFVATIMLAFVSWNGLNSAVNFATSRTPLRYSAAFAFANDQGIAM